MNRPDQPLSADTLDELLSADIDGELDRAATELGFTPAAARAALDASPDAVERRAALLRARDLLAAPVALGADATERLVTNALARAADAGQEDAPQQSIPSETPLHRHRFQNSWRALAGVATAAAVIAGVVVLSAQNPAQEAKSSSAPTFKEAAERPAMDAGLVPVSSFGEVTPPDSLRAQVEQRLSQKQAQASSNTTALAAPAATAPATARAEGNTTSYDSAQATNCLASFPEPGQLPVLFGPGTDKGRPVFVAVFKKGGTYDIYVLSAADCSVVSRSTLP